MRDSKPEDLEYIAELRAEIDRVRKLLEGWKTEAYKVADEKDKLYCAAIERVKATKAEAALKGRGRMAELKPCPFCGGEARVSTDPEATRDSHGRLWAFTVVCDKCCATSGLTYSTDKATEAWNRRTDNA